MTLMTPAGQENHILITGVVYCPNFHVNVIAYNPLIEKNIFYNSEEGILYARVNGKKLGFGQVTWCQGLFFLELPTYLVNATQRSAEPLVSTADASIWHRRLGHIYRDNINQLAQMVDGVVVTGRPTSLCDTCNLSQAPAQISRREAT